MFVLWNKQGKNIDTQIYKNTFLNGWGYEVAVYGDGTNIFHQSDKGTSDVAVVASFCFNADKNGGGYDISGATGEQMHKAATRLSKLNHSLRENKKPAPESSSDIASMVSVALTGGN